MVRWRSTRPGWVALRQGIRGSRQLKGRGAALVLVAVEKRGRATGRLRMAVIPDFKTTTMKDGPRGQRDLVTAGGAFPASLANQRVAAAVPASGAHVTLPSTTSSRRTWLRERPSTPMGSKVSGAWKRLGSSLSPALSH